MRRGMNSNNNREENREKEREVGGIKFACEVVSSLDYGGQRGGGVFFG